MFTWNRFLYITVVLWHQCVLCNLHVSVWKLKYWIIYLVQFYVLCTVCLHMFSLLVHHYFVFLCCFFCLSFSVFNDVGVSSYWWVLIKSNLTVCNIDNTCMHTQLHACFHMHTHRHAHVNHWNIYTTTHAHTHTHVLTLTHTHHLTELKRLTQPCLCICTQKTPLTPTPSVITLLVSDTCSPQPCHIHTVNDVQKANNIQSTLSTTTFTHSYITSHKQSVYRWLTFRLPIHKHLQPQNERCQLIKAYIIRHQGRSLVNNFSLEYWVQKCGTFSDLVAQLSVPNSY